MRFPRIDDLETQRPVLHRVLYSDIFNFGAVHIELIYPVADCVVYVIVFLLIFSMGFTVRYLVARLQEGNM